MERRDACNVQRVGGGLRADQRESEIVRAGKNGRSGEILVGNNDPIEMLDNGIAFQPYDPQVLQNMVNMFDEVKIGL